MTVFKYYIVKRYVENVLKKLPDRRWYSESLTHCVPLNDVGLLYGSLYCFHLQRL